MDKRISSQFCDSYVWGVINATLEKHNETEVDNAISFCDLGLQPNLIGLYFNQQLKTL